MQASGLAEADCYPGPMPRTSPILGITVPESHEKDALDQGNPISLVLHVIQNLGSWIRFDTGL
jgi:hypothetical protein